MQASACPSPARLPSLRPPGRPSVPHPQRALPSARAFTRSPAACRLDSHSFHRLPSASYPSIGVLPGPGPALQPPPRPPHATHSSILWAVHAPVSLPVSPSSSRHSASPLGRDTRCSAGGGGKTSLGGLRGTPGRAGVFRARLARELCSLGTAAPAANRESQPRSCFPVPWEKSFPLNRTEHGRTHTLAAVCHAVRHATRASGSFQTQAGLALAWGLRPRLAPDALRPRAGPGVTRLVARPREPLSAPTTPDPPA